MWVSQSLLITVVQPREDLVCWSCITGNWALESPSALRGLGSEASVQKSLPNMPGPNSWSMFQMQNQKLGFEVMELGPSSGKLSSLLFSWNWWKNYGTAPMWMDECFTLNSFRCVVALLIHTDNMFMSSKDVFLVPCTDLVPVTDWVSAACLRCLWRMPGITSNSGHGPECHLLPAHGYSTVSFSFPHIKPSKILKNSLCHFVCQRILVSEFSSERPSSS